MNRRFSDRLKGSFGCAFLSVAMAGVFGATQTVQVAVGLLGGALVFFMWRKLP